MKITHQTSLISRSVSLALCSFLLTACLSSNDNPELDDPKSKVTAPLVNNLADGALINNRNLNISGTGLKGNTIKIIGEDGVELMGPVIVDADGNWSITLTELSDGGEYTFKIVATEQSSGESIETSFFTVTVDLTPPLKPTIEEDLLASLQGQLQPELKGKADAGSKIEILMNGQLLGEATADDNGDWTIKINTSLPEGSNSLTIIATDPAGNISESDNIINIAIDTTAPEKPEINPIASPTNNSKPSISGTAEANSNVEIFVGAESKGMTTAESTGIWTLTFENTLIDGTHQISAIATDNASNTSISSEPLELTIDKTPPEKPNTPVDEGFASTSHKIAFSWPATVDATSGISHYNLQVSTNPNFTSNIVFSENIENVTNYNYSAQFKDLDYYAQIQAVDLTGNESEWSNASDGINVNVSTSLNYAKTIQGISNTVKAVKKDSQANMLIAGYFTGVANLDPNKIELPIDAGISDDAYLVKLDNNGNYLWSWVAKSNTADFLPNNNLARATSLAVDSNGNSYITGHFSGPMHFNPNPQPEDEMLAGKGYTFGFRNVFITKISSDGIYQWTQTFQGNSWDYAHGITVDSNSNIYIIGSFQSTNIGFDPTVEEKIISKLSGDDPAVGSDMFVSKLDSDGNLVWVKNFGTQVEWGDQVYTSQASGHSITLNQDESKILLTASFIDIFDITPEDFGLSGQYYTEPEKTNLLVLQMDSATHNFDWAYQINAWSTDIDGDNWAGTNAASWLTTNSLGQVFVTGYFQNTANFGPAPEGQFSDYRTSFGSNDIFLTKLSPTGTYLWTNTIGSISDDRSEGIAIDEQESIYLTGRYGSSVDFDASDTGDDTFASTGVSDAFITKTHQDGSYGWTRTFESAVDATTFGRAITIKENKLVTVGNLSSTADFDPNKGVATGGTENTNSVYISELSLLASPPPAE